MSEQPEFDWTRTHARSTDPDTSKRAAALASIRAGSHKDRILEAMRYAQKPLSFEGVARATGLRESACWKRLSDLKNDGLIYVVDSDGKTAQGASCDRYGVIEL